MSICNPNQYTLIRGNCIFPPKTRLNLAASKKSHISMSGKMVDTGQYTPIVGENDQVLGYYATSALTDEEFTASRESSILWWLELTARVAEFQSK